MSPTAVYLVLALIAATTVVGLLWRSRQGTAARRSRRTTLVITPADLGSDMNAGFGSRATLLQFSTEFCASCPSTRRMLGAVADGLDGVTHVDVDLTHRGDLANKYGILQTPTTFILDGAGLLVARIGGSARRDVVQHELESIVSVH
jgi:thiol-disulfide isomerase/thioredoxin